MKVTKTDVQINEQLDNKEVISVCQRDYADNTKKSLVPKTCENSLTYTFCLYKSFKLC